MANIHSTTGRCAPVSPFPEVVEIKQVIGMSVKLARQTLNLSQMALAEEIDRCTETVSNIERGLTLPSINTLARIGRALDMPMTEFFQDDDNKMDKNRFVLELETRHMVKRLPFVELKIVKKYIALLLDSED